MIERDRKPERERGKERETEKNGKRQTEENNTEDGWERIRESAVESQEEWESDRLGGKFKESRRE